MCLSVVMFGFGYCFSLQAFMGQKNGEKLSQHGRSPALGHPLLDALLCDSYGGRLYGLHAFLSARGRIA